MSTRFACYRVYIVLELQRRDSCSSFCIVAAYLLSLTKCHMELVKFCCSNKYFVVVLTLLCERNSFFVSGTNQHAPVHKGLAFYQTLWHIAYTSFIIWLHQMWCFRLNKHARRNTYVLSLFANKWVQMI